MKTNERAKVTRKPVFFYPGRDSKYNLKAIHADNTLITGCTASGKTQMINQIIIQLIQNYSPNDVKIHVIDGHGFEQTDWKVRKKGKVDENRTLPHIVYTGQTVESDKSNYIHDVCAYIKSVANKRISDKQNGNSIKWVDVIFIDDVSLTEELKKDFLSIGSLNENVVIVYATKPSDTIDEDFISMFKNRICFKSSDRVSELMLHCNAATSEFLHETGVCYYSRQGTGFAYEKLWVPFTPISVINKLIGAFSVRLSNANS